jgi:suppressor of tumorigenicity protein 13
MDPTKVADLKAFVAACKKDPGLLADPSLGFFRDYLAILGAKLPQPASASASASKPAGPKVLILILIHPPFSAPDPPPPSRG